LKISRTLLLFQISSRMDFVSLSCPAMNNIFIPDYLNDKIVVDSWQGDI